MLCSLEVQGRNKRWSFPVEVNPENLAAWRADGLHIDELVHEEEWEARALLEELDERRDECDLPCRS